MTRRALNPNAEKALEEMKLEISKKMGLANNLNKLDPIENMFTAGLVGGMMTKNLVEMGQKQLINKK
ncbi:small, acid-soluble spore protein, alpha/beta type [Proteiniborus sp. MB09-C3]|uniref:small, acid-soluble spore protein, alpha/beta type n=1 Tax=Proteiniborus sp. MB09-C3 TaxID=3050072 RepID=UPI00255349B7|nr:small, acid-soluble spore protein, alpha/beta type [Proteiniborus sp. MB09-C3]WIV11711.1 small, acid-soluble spore protein, alpha/beta type [Proteiniborus sp. MB09-C3]